MRTDSQPLVLAAGSRVERADQDVQQMVDADADLVSRQPDDAGIPRPKHLDFDAAAQTEFFQSMDVIRLADDVGHAS